MASSQGKRNFLVIGFLAGAVLGGVAAGLKTPRSGVEIRHAIREQSLAWKDQAENIVLQAKTTVGQLVHRD